MTEIRIPDNRDLMYPTLVAVRHLGGSATKSELLEKVPEFAGVSDEQLAVVFPEDSRYEGKSKVLYRITWACTHLKRIGALENSQRGVWSITPKGLRYLDADGTEEALKRAGKAESRKRRKARAAQQSDIVEENEDAIEVDEEGEEDWKGALLDVLKSMEPSAFERLSMRLVKEAGFRNVEVLGKAGDGGIDGVGVYKVSLVSFPTYFQCKRYTGSVPSRAVRDFRGAMAGRGDKGILITTGTFTREAKTEAVRDGAPPVDLIDGDELCELLREYGIGVRVQVRTVEDITIDQAFFEGMQCACKALPAIVIPLCATVKQRRPAPRNVPRAKAGGTSPGQSTTAAFQIPYRDTRVPSGPADRRDRVARPARRSVSPRPNLPA